MRKFEEKKILSHKKKLKKKVSGGGRSKKKKCPFTIPFCFQYCRRKGGNDRAPPRPDVVDPVAGEDVAKEENTASTLSRIGRYPETLLLQINRAAINGLQAGGFAAMLDLNM